MAFCGLGVREVVCGLARAFVYLYPPKGSLAGLAGGGGGGGCGGGLYWNHCVLIVRAAAGGDAVVASVATCSRLNCGDV